MRKCLMMLILAIGGVAAEEVNKLPASVQVILDKTERDVAKNRQSYETANAKIFDASEKSIKAELEKLTKAGKLEDAIAAKKVLETLRIDIVGKIDDAAKNNLYSKEDIIGENGGSFDGKWKIQYSNGAWRETKIKRSGNRLLLEVLGGSYGVNTNYIAVLDKEKNIYISDNVGNDGKSESYEVVEGKLKIRHWHSGATYDSPLVTACGIKMEGKK